MTHICVSKQTIIGSDNGLSPGRRQAIIWTNAGQLLIGPSGTNFIQILIEILTFSFKKMPLKVSSAKRRPFCLGLNVLTHWPPRDMDVISQVHETHFRNWYLELFLRNWPLVSAPNPIDDKSTLVRVMVRCCQAPSHYLSQCWPRSMSSYGATKPQWVNTFKAKQNAYHFVDGIFTCIFCSWIVVLWLKCR